MSWLLRKRTSSIGSIASTATDASSPSDNHELQASVIRATRPLVDPSKPDELNADPHGLEEIAEQARGNRKGFASDLVKMLKARLKSEDPKIVFLAIKVFDTCMQECGVEFQGWVAKKALDRMSKLAAPGQGSTAVQMLAAETVLKWGSLYGDKDKTFKKAAQTLTDRETRMLQDEFKKEYNDVKERVKAMKIAQQADLAELKAAMQEMGITPKTTETQESLQKMPIPILLARAGEASDMLEAIMSSSTPADLEANEVAHEQVISCLKYQTHIDIVEPRIRDAATKAQAERTLSELGQRIEAFLVATSAADGEHQEAGGRPPDVDPSNGEVAARLKTVKKIIRQRLAHPPTAPPPPAPSALPAASAPAVRSPNRNEIVPREQYSYRNEIEPRSAYEDSGGGGDKKELVHMPDGKYPYERPPATAPSYSPPKKVVSTPPPFNPYHSSPSPSAQSGLPTSALPSPYAGAGAVSSGLAGGGSHSGATSYAVRRPPQQQQQQQQQQTPTKGEGEGEGGEAWDKGWWRGAEAGARDSEDPPF